MTATDSNPDVRTETADLSLTCARCRYRLKGLRLGGVCPECAFPIERSLPGGLLLRMDVYELGTVRAALGQWGVMLLAMGFVLAAMDLACPSLVPYTGLFMYARLGVQAVLMFAAVFMWLPLLRLRRQVSSVWVQRGGAVAAMGLWLGPLLLVAGRVVEHLGAFSSNGVVFAYSRWYYAGLALTGVGRVLVAAFFVFGMRFTTALRQDESAEVGRGRWVAVLGATGALLPLVVDAMGTPQVMQLIWTSNVSDEAVEWVSYLAIAASGVLVGVACLAWAGICGRIEQWARERTDDLDAAKLKAQLESSV